ncbi:MAG TPA: hypothetical protein VHA77_12840 [Xanthobacteraceae bacterium]|jgi:hypothetical protein|nr:hypothetical protein [Xanthobacteraceae bacterium]
MDRLKALIEKLSRELEAMGDLVGSEYTLKSPEVQEVPMLGLHLSIAEARLIRDVLQSCDQLRNELCS